MSFTKDIILKYLNEKLIPLLNEVQKDDEDNLFHPDLIKVMETIKKVEKSKEDEIQTKILIEMNIVWRKNQLIKKYKEKNPNKKIPHNTIIDMTVVSIGKGEGKVAAIRFCRENILKENGEVMSLQEAKQYVEDVSKLTFV